MTSFMSDPLAGIEEMIGPAVTDFPSVPDTYSPANRPQDIRYVFPERGTESHGVNDDTPTSEYFPNQTDGGPQIVTDDGSRNIYTGEELVPADPVAVYEVPHPQRSIRKWTQFNTLFDSITMTWTLGAAFAIDMNTVTSIAADETRTRISFYLSRSRDASANAVYCGLYAVSTNPDFTDFVIIGPTSAALFQPGVALRLDNCKESFYCAFIPALAYDGVKHPLASLVVIQEYAAPIDHNPVQAD